ncbi:hypothetical protein F7725_028910 [Dissostichus mawsoni]|uniref:EF-hand domain-containing protein n=9 Tax=Notothenioidei TaxID=8205 RepID=A0A7J5XGZ2_DISMA|nr:hypothetical protein F7725_028910 [Dissostichus mawsoni]
MRSAVSRMASLLEVCSDLSISMPLRLLPAPEDRHYVADDLVVLIHSQVNKKTVNMSSKRAKGKTTKKRPQRATSNVFAMFDQSQIQEFKEAFNMIDQNRDGFVDKEDLHDMLASLGKNPTDEYLEAMMMEAPGPINFTMFLTMFGEKLNGTDPEDVIRNAFACFDEEGAGSISEDYLRDLLTTMGDRFTDEEVDELFREAPIDKKSNFNYVEFTRILKHGAKDKDD